MSTYFTETETDHVGGAEGDLYTVLDSVGEGMSRWILRMDYKMKISLQHWRSSGGRRGFSVELGSHLA